MRDSHLHRLHDAIHGNIDYVAFGSAQFTLGVETILSSEYMRRLKHVKQLGFVSENYLSASHDRYTHSIGTMVMMRSLLDRLAQQSAFDRSECPLLDDAVRAFPKAFGASNMKPRGILEDHLLIAALIQDIGELPYNIATSGLFEPHHQLVSSLEKLLEATTMGLEAKVIFSLAALRELAKLPQLKPFNFPFLAFLISGVLPGAVSPSGGLAALRQMMDGAVDADRLDYVHRDAFHALGVRRDPQDIIASLCYFDSDGPVFNDAGPVADFFATRAMLWSSIYLHPSNRFRTVLLSIVLGDVVRQRVRGSLSGDFAFAAGGVKLDDFIKLDDLYVDDLLRKLLAQKDFNFDTSKAQKAAEILISDGPEYNYYWVGRPAEGEIRTPALTIDKLPDELFWDNYSDYQSHRLYTPGTVRVSIDHYKYVRDPMLLEDCSGPFNVILDDKVSGLPMPGMVTVFRPTESETEISGLWDDVETMTENGALFDLIETVATTHSMLAPFDTRTRSGFTGGALFISFATQDIRVVSQICLELYRRRLRYFCLADPFVGIGGTPRENSVKAVEGADAVLLLFSPAFADRFKHAPDGNLAAEVHAMIKRKASQPSFPILPLSTVAFSEMQDRLPWRDLGFADGQVPMVGKPLQEPLVDLVRHAVDMLPVG